MHAVLVPCTCYFVLLWYSLAFGPQSPGLVAGTHPKGSLVRAVQAGLPAARAGLETGDIILSVNGQTGRAIWTEFDRVYVGKPFEVAFERDGDRSSASWTLGRKDRAFWTSPEGLAYIAGIPGTLLGLLLAWLIAFRLSDVATARLGALLFASGASGSFLLNPPPGFPTFLSSLPLPLAALPLAAIIADYSASGPLSMMFLASFPRRRVIGRRVWLVVWLPAVLGLCAVVVDVARDVYGAQFPPAYTAILTRPSRLLALLYMCAFPLVLVWNYRALTDVGDRRRLRLLIVGTLIGSIPGVIDVSLRILGSLGIESARALLLAYWLSPAFAVGALVGLAGTCLSAYAILRHRVFDLGIIIRQGLQYAAARNVLLALAPVCLLLLVADLALHSNQTMAQAFMQRGWFYAVVGGAALLAHAKRKAWLEGLDRHFFRERYDAQRILRTMLTDVRQAGSLDEAAPRVVAQVESALHPGFAAILVRRTDEAMFRVVASSGPAPPEIPSDSKLMALVRLLGKPMEMQRSDTSWLHRQLPPAETQWLRNAGIEWIFPIALGADRTEVLLALAPKRSEQPYSQEDQDLIEGFVSGLGLLAERLVAPPASSAWPPPVPGTAPGAAPAGMVRLAQRYVIGRELGRGGMGSVYEAHDTELERDVAIKVMRPELMASADAVVRFKREARAAAGFSHYNVVTVHDFGVADEGRAFLVMERLVGSTLRTVLRQEGPLPPPRAAAILRGVCAAAAAAHDRNLLHRDLKPENIFLVRAGAAEVPKVLDFGVAKLLAVPDDAATFGGDTSPGLLLGTLAYMSPEQLRGMPPNRSWDLWALAVIAYEMLAGAHPFLGAAAGDAVLPPRRAAPHLARIGAGADRWDAFFARALAPEAHDRPGSALELLAEFERALVE